MEWRRARRTLTPLYGLGKEAKPLNEPAKKAKNRRYEVRVRL